MEEYPNTGVSPSPPNEGRVWQNTISAYINKENSNKKLFTDFPKIFLYFYLQNLENIVSNNKNIKSFNLSRTQYINYNKEKLNSYFMILIKRQEYLWKLLLETNYIFYIKNNINIKR